MKRLLLASLFFFLPATAFAVPTKQEQFKKLENELSLECQKYGAESCAARFISMATCSYVFAVNQGKDLDEAMNIADQLFVSIMRGNKIKPEIMLTEEGNMKPVITNEVAERTFLCKEATEKAVPKLFEARGMEKPSKEIQERLTNSFGYWWISTIETIYKQGKE